MMNEVDVNMRITEAERSAEKLILTQLSRPDAVLKLVELQGERRYFPLRSQWHEAITLGIMGLKRVEQHEQIAEEVCDKVCRWRERALQENKDPDDAQEWLEKNYCNSGCPINRMME